MNPYFLAAGVLSAGVCLTHVFLGGKYVARPILHAHHLGSIPKYTAYFCWHMVTLTVAAMALAFFMAGMTGAMRELAWFASGGALSFTLLCIAINLRYRLNFWRHPQWALFLPVALVGFIGLIA